MYLISGPQLNKKGLSFVGGGGVIDITRGDILFSAYLNRGFYQLFPRTPKPYQMYHLNLTLLVMQKE